MGKEFLKSRGNRTKDESVIHMNDMKKIDEIIVQQYCIRRLKLESPDEFEKLAAFRGELDETLKQAGFTISTNPIQLDRVLALMGCLRFVELKKNRKLVKQGEPELARAALIDELADDSPIEITKNFLTNEILDKLLSSMREWEPLLTEFEKKYNYLKYYSLYGITNHVPGEVIYKRFFESYHELDEVYYDATMFKKEALWLHSKTSYRDEQLAHLVRTSANEVAHFSSNIKIFGGGQHQIKIEEVELKDHLILAIPTDQTPKNIDDALYKLRTALLSAFIEQGGYHRFSSDEFDNSKFMSDYTYKPCVVGQWNRVKNKIVGLWAWDTSRSKTVAETVNFVREEMGNFAKTVGIKTASYSEKSIQLYYESAVGQIGTGRRTSDGFCKMRDIDRQVTKSETILGLTEH
ncbi:hypothetical protein [Pseudomonas sp. CFBP 8772]|uniref:hypothetical protein n=1 Tax=Pseudomonas sp. CFBP 8772 TaxID=2775284 RepID=UPI00177F4D32|nr:hypothetical protein [Pseudomonas sp. CFBP 8772]MBD8599502.1 hypothetical protein [Pseudomonas sp. CFBP 8772]MBF9247081.1 hypothetical protein [Pseudomonas syringae pv. tomato]MBW8023041.1 hypothetical protein [Pseudomonas syringae pv. tomato]